MAFKDVYNALHTQLSNDATLLGYMSADDFVKGFKESMPVRRYMVILEPGPEIDEEGNQDYGRIKEVEYEIQTYCRIVLTSTRIESVIVGNDSYKGLLDFTEDVKDAIRKDLTLSYNAVGYSSSIENAAGSFDLDASNRFIAVSIDGRTPTGYDVIDCGSSTLAGAAVATNIQASLRALGQISNDGYSQATCSFNAATNQFTISSSNYGPRGQVTVTAGASDDASSLLGFSSPTEQRGTNLVKIRFGNISVENGAFPVRFRIIPVLITEEIIVGG
jgi:hypothetical protein